jgi:hypothetical protein
LPGRQLVAMVCPLWLRCIRRQLRSPRPLQASPRPRSRQAAGKLDLATARSALAVPRGRHPAATVPTLCPPLPRPPRHRRPLPAAAGPPCICTRALAPQRVCPPRRQALRLLRCRRRMSPGRARGLLSALFCRRRCPLHQGHRHPAATHAWAEAGLGPHEPELAALPLIMALAGLQPGGVPRLMTAARLLPRGLPRRVLPQARRAAGRLACERPRSALLGRLLAGQTRTLGLRAPQDRRLVAAAAGPPLFMLWRSRRAPLRRRPRGHRLSHGPLLTWRQRWRRCSWLRGTATWMRGLRPRPSTRWPSHTPRLRPTRHLPQAPGPRASSRPARGRAAAAVPKGLPRQQKPLMQVLR